MASVSKWLTIDHNLFIEHEDRIRFDLDMYDASREEVFAAWMSADVFGEVESGGKEGNPTYAKFLGSRRSCSMTSARTRT
jgi:hypothetical protein